MPASKVLETLFMCKRSTQFVLDGGMNDDFFSFHNAFKLYKSAYDTSATVS